MQNFIFGIYPYIALTVFVLGSWIRFDREQYTWKSDSSQMLDNDKMRLGSNLFHVGVIAIFFGHLVGLVTPHGLFLAFGISDMAHQNIAIFAGTIFGLCAFAGGIILWMRRTGNPRIRATSRKSDVFILTWILVTLALGLTTIPVSISHSSNGDPSTMIALANWVQSVLFLHADPTLLNDVSAIYKLHMFFGMTVFLVFPFTRLVHIWSVPLTYLGRAYQIVRTKQVSAR